MADCRRINRTIEQTSSGFSVDMDLSSDEDWNEQLVAGLPEETNVLNILLSGSPSVKPGTIMLGLVDSHRFLVSLTLSGCGKVPLRHNGRVLQSVVENLKFLYHLSACGLLVTESEVVQVIQLNRLNSLVVSSQVESGSADLSARRIILGFPEFPKLERLMVFLFDETDMIDNLIDPSLESRKVMRYLNSKVRVETFLMSFEQTSGQ
ncbi:hypothetical protein HDE_12466 [Halotydeus destructor]|nr:hypothetical protein HDE_12466 [Halotydeus destructor]